MLVHEPAADDHTGLTNLRLAHKLVATAATLKGAKRLLKTARRKPNAHDDRLAQPD